MTIPLMPLALKLARTVQVVVVFVVLYAITNPWNDPPPHPIAGRFPLIQLEVTFCRTPADEKAPTAIRSFFPTCDGNVAATVFPEYTSAVADCTSLISGFAVTVVVAVTMPFGFVAESV